MKLPLELLQSIGDEEAQSEFIAAFGGYKFIRERLIHYLELQVDKLIKESEKDSWYDCPNMHHKHADNIGQRKSLRKIINLLKAE